VLATSDHHHNAWLLQYDAMTECTADCPVLAPWLATGSAVHGAEGLLSFWDTSQDDGTMTKDVAELATGLDLDLHEGLPCIH
jgi:hypothetical protein